MNMRKEYDFTKGERGKFYHPEIANDVKSFF